MIADWLVNALRPYSFRGKVRLLNPLTPARGVRQATVFGSQMDLELGHAIQRDIYFGTYEREETALARQYLKPGMTVVDAGANVGYYTALAAAATGPQGRVYSFEPQPEPFRKLQAMVERNMVERNRLAQVAVFNCGLSAQPGDVTMYLAPETELEFNGTMVPHASGRQIVVPVRTLDDCVAELGIPRIDLLKIDVEGHEPSVFAGASRTLAEKRIRAVLCEFNDFWLSRVGSGAGDLMKFLQSAGFRDPSGKPAPAAGCMETRLLLQGE